MKKKISYVVLCCLLLAAVLAVAVACDDNNTTTKSVVSAEAVFVPQEEYIRNQNVDLSSLEITVTYDDDTTDKLYATSKGVTVEGADTSTVGAHTLTVKYDKYSWTFDFTVRDTVLTLVAGNGKFGEGETKKVITTPDNYTSVADIGPTPDNEANEFAGWFYDSEFTRPVNYTFDGKVDTSSDLTLYAGYDIDYSDTFTYSIDANNEVTILTFDPMSPLIGFLEFSIPSTIKLLPVVKIEDDFWSESHAVWSTYSDLKFNAPSHVREIGKKAFAYSSFKRVTLPDTLEYIDEQAFTTIEIETISFPASLRRIDNSAFEACAYLSEINFAKNPELEYIGESAFKMCGKVSIVNIPDSVTNLGNSAFANCEMLSVVKIGQSVKSIGLHAFSGCSNLHLIDVNKNNAYYSTIDGNLFTKNGKEIVRYCFGKSETEYVVPAGVTDIQESAFDCYNMNTTLEKITLPDSVVSIWAYAFRECEAEIEIPASVKNIGDYAFSRNALVEFKVAEDNKAFVVKDGVLYTKDMKELVAVPSMYANETFTLPSTVEKIRSGAMSYNKTIKYIVIPSDSALKNIVSHGLVLGECRALCGVYIQTSAPFEMADDAMAVDDGSSMSNKNFIVYVNDDVASAFTEKWRNSLLCLPGDFSSEVLLNDYVATVKTIGQRLYDELAEIVGEFTDVDSFTAAMDGWLDLTGDFINYFNFEGVFGFIDGVYNSDYDITSVVEILKVFESKSINFLTEKYSAYDVTEFGTAKSFYNVISHYNNIPDVIKSALGETEAKFAPIKQRTDEYAEIQRKNIQEIAAIVSDYSNWDIERATEAYKTSVEYGWNIVGSRWGDQMNQFRLLCSIHIYNFLQCDVNVENLAELRSYLEDSYDDNFNIVYGLKFHFDSYFSTETSRETLYKYDEFKQHYAAMTELITNVNEAMANYDLASFDETSFRKVLTAFNYLLPGEYSDEAYGIKMLGQIRLYLADLLSNAVTEDNYEESLVKFSNIENMTMGDTSILVDCGASESDIAAYNKAKQQILAIFTNRNAELINIVNSTTSENFADNIEQLMSLYDQALRVESDLLGIYTIEFTIDGETYVDTLSSACASLIRCQKIIEATQNFESVTKENWSDFNMVLYGEDSISVYEQLMNFAYQSYYENIGLTSDVVTKYNKLMEEYRNAWPSVWNA